MSKAAGLSEKSVRRIWHQQGLKPHLARTFKVGNDPLFAEKLEAIISRFFSRGVSAEHRLAQAAVDDLPSFGCNALDDLCHRPRIQTMTQERTGTALMELPQALLEPLPPADRE